MINSKGLNQEYQLALSNYKQFMQQNAYAKELHEKYHKAKHRLLRKSNKLDRLTQESPILIWPIESAAFTNILRSKLKLPDIPRQRVSKSQINYNFLQDIQSKHKKGLSLENTQLPKFVQNRYWSPPNLKDFTSDLLENKQAKLFGPKIKRLKYENQSYL
jgi:hypothetical protein